MKLAAIDIGSNAIRMQISKAFNHDDGLQFKKLEYIRFPLRLGQDVFNTGEISPKTEERFVKLMLAFKQFLELYEVDDYMVCATSAMREAHNGAHIAKRVYYSIGLRIHIIDGESEGTMINKAILPHLDEGNYLHIDVGGGSTEITFLRNREKVGVRSFRMGSVRTLSEEKETLNFDRVRFWMEKYIAQADGPIRGIGTGGNIKKLAELSNTPTMSLNKLRELVAHVSNISMEDRIRKLSMNPDRADVIVPASKIYLNVLEMGNVQEIFVPDVGLKDGIIASLYQKHSK